jgi:hypothetical protein
VSSHISLHPRRTASCSACRNRDVPIPVPRSGSGTNTIAIYREPQSDQAQSPPISSSVSGSFNSTARVRAVASPTAASLKLRSGAHIFWNASGGFVFRRHLHPRRPDGESKSSFGANEAGMRTAASGPMRRFAAARHNACNEAEADGAGRGQYRLLDPAVLTEWYSPPIRRLVGL